jgi:uncharacterized membrane protein YoaK (UPF0700 family)
MASSTGQHQQRAGHSVSVNDGSLNTRSLAFILSVIAGSTDTIGFLALNGLFTAHITGNVVILAAHLIAGDPALLSYILAVPVFMLMLLLTTLFANRLERSGVATLQALLWLQLLLLIVFLALCVRSHARFDANSALAVVAGMFGVGAMAVQSALVQISLTNIPSTAVMTTNVAHFVIALGEVLCRADVDAVDKARKRISHLLPVIAGFALGCAVGAAGGAAWGSRSLGFPVALATVALIVAYREALVSSAMR